MMLIAIVVLGVVSSCQGVTMQELQPYNETAYMMFQVTDTNMDGIMTLVELEQSFDKYDANGDGTESRHEYTEYICATTPMLYQLSHYLYDEYDADGDHHLHKSDYDMLFSKMDKDSNGMVTDAEFVEYWEVIFPKYEKHGTHGQTHVHGHSACH